MELIRKRGYEKIKISNRFKDFINLSSVFWVNALLLIFLFFFISNSAVIDFNDSIIMDSGMKKAVNDPVNKFISIKCSKELGDYDKIVCVNNELSSFYFFDYNRSLDDSLLRYSKNMVYEGGVCRDYVVNFCSVMRGLGLSCRHSSFETHMVALVYADFGYCLVDQGFLECFNLE